VVHSKKFVSTKVSKQIAPFQQELQICECDVKNDSIGLPESSRTKYPTQTPSVDRNSTPTPPKTSDSLRLRLRNPGLHHCLNVAA